MLPVATAAGSSLSLLRALVASGRSGTHKPVLVLRSMLSIKHNQCGHLHRYVAFRPILLDVGDDRRGGGGQRGRHTQHSGPAAGR